MFLEMASPETISPVAEHNLQRRLSAFGSIVSALLAVVVAFGIGQMTRTALPPAHSVVQVRPISIDTIVLPETVMFHAPRRWRT